jgi:hypothetical protein
MSKRKRSKGYWQQLREKQMEKQIAKKVRSVPGWRKRLVDHDVTAKRGQIKSWSPEREAKRISSVVSGGLPSLGKR